MSAVESFSLLFAVFFLSISGVTAYRLIALARTTRKAPEWSMAVGLLGTGIFGFGFSVACESVRASDSDLATIFQLAGALSVSIACVAFAVFTERVFHPGRVGARRVVIAVAVAFLGLFILSVKDFVISGGGRDDPAMLGRCAVLSFVWGWMGVECLKYYGAMRRRLAIGLADPVVVNRFALWTYVSFESLSLNWLSTGLAIQSGVNGLSSDLMVMSTGLFGMTGAAAIYLAFVPPKAYTQWVMERSEKSLAASA